MILLLVALLALTVAVSPPTLDTSLNTVKPAGNVQSVGNIIVSRREHNSNACWLKVTALVNSIDTNDTDYGRYRSSIKCKISNCY